MLESVLADVLTRVLGQYLQGIDRDSVQFGAWSGLIELRKVALRPEALAVLFETIGLALPVTVESGFIDLLRLVVPWKSIGSSPVQLYMHGITVIARPVSGDGSNDSQLRLRHGRINRAKLNTDDAVREASWNVVNQRDQSNQDSWSSWLVSDQLRATIINNIQIHLSDIIIRFEDPYSNPKSPYVASLHCESLKIVSTDAQWQEVFLDNSNQSITRKLLQIKGFHVDWAPLPTSKHPVGTSSSEQLNHTNFDFESPEMLRKYVSFSSLDNSANAPPTSPRSLIHSVDGSIRLCLTADGPTFSGEDFRVQQPSADLDIIFPEILIELNDVQYGCLMQTSLYFARIATRGFRPSTAKARWKWAVDQLLPGCTARFARALRFTSDGLAETRSIRDSYIAYRASLLKARRKAVDEPKVISEKLEKMEDSLEFEEVLAYRDAVDAQVEKDEHLWIPSPDIKQSPDPSQADRRGTTMNSFWSMLGYNEDSSLNRVETDRTQNGQHQTDTISRLSYAPSTSTSPIPSASYRARTTLGLRAAFLLRGATVRMSEGGYPTTPTPRVELKMHNFRIGLLYSSAKDLVVEAVLGSIEAWDVQNHSRMIYSRSTFTGDSSADRLDPADFENSYPHDVSDAIEKIRNGANPAKELLDDEGIEAKSDEKEFLDDDDTNSHIDLPTGVSGSMDGLGLRSKGDKYDREGAPSLKYQITEEEFFGTSKHSDALNYVVALRYSKLNDNEDLQSNQSSTLDVSVATLEAVVDGPKGSFIWGLKFWQPKGLIQDPIMAFLGAAAGARIAQMRMELEQALLTDSVQMEVNAVILAPRFIIPSKRINSPSIVVNMGTLGICTSDSSPRIHGHHRQNTELKHLRYSNYVLTLDDLGIYFSPDLLTSISRNLLVKSRGDGSKILHTDDDFEISDQPDAPANLAEVERIIRPFSLRFVLQTLQDSKVVQVAHGVSATGDELDEEGIAKVRLRGKIPQLSLILTEKSFQHMLATAYSWSDVLGSNKSRASAGLSPPSDLKGGVESFGGVVSPRKDSLEISTEALPGRSTLSSYSVKLLIQSMSMELRESVDVKLVTASLLDLSANIVKRGKSNLHADLLLRSWSVTDESRGKTAAFRRLLYSGTVTDSDGVSPPRPSIHADKNAAAEKEKEHFVSVRYLLDLHTHEQQLIFRFLSLHMNFVRETYLRLLSFFDRVRGHVSQHRRSSSVQLGTANVPSLNEHTIELLPSQSICSMDVSNNRSEEGNVGKGATSIVSEFDGFSFQLVSSEGVVAVFEMKNSSVNFLRATDGSKKAWGNLGSMSVRDLTAPVQEHVLVLNYDRLPLDTPRPPDGPQKDWLADGWELMFPNGTNDPYRLTASFESIHMLYLHRFSEVLSNYSSAFVKSARPAMSSIIEETKAEFPESEGLMSSDAYTSISSKLVVSIDLRRLVFRIPRHSSCLSESLTFKIGELHVDNIKDPKDMKWFANFEGVQGAVQYTAVTDGGECSNSTTSSIFLADCSTEMYFQPSRCTESVSETPVKSVVKLASMQFKGPLRVNLSEAQYTVLYFVLTENFGESVSSDGESTSVEEVSSSLKEPSSHLISSSSGNSEIFHNEDGVIGIDRDKLAFDFIDRVISTTHTLRIEMKLPVLSFELSRGWDVTQDSCKILGVYLTNVVLGVSLSTPSRRAFEIVGTLHSIIDLREDSQYLKRNIVAHLLSLDAQGGEDGVSTTENVSVTYENVSNDRPSITVALDKLQIEMVPELMRDLTYLAIPGWPFLKTSMFAPDFQYVGRTVTLVLNNSQVLLLSESSASDRRALILTGEFELKVDWKRSSGAKTIVLLSKGLEVSSVNEVPPLKETGIDFGYGLKDVCALPFEKSHSPLIYPTDSVIEFVGPNVDDAGRRVHISVDAALCMLCTSEIPVLGAILERLGSLKPSYLSQRQWAQPMIAPGSRSTQSLDRKEEEKRKARDNLNITLNIPVSRYVITDDRAGRFVPILEVRLSSLLVQTHGSSMVQVEGSLSMDLFNPNNGCWESSVEPWSMSASMSRGQSGARAFVLRSDERLNLNIAPTSITAAKTVAKALRSFSENVKRKEGSVVLARRKSIRQEVTDPSAVRRPSVAVFLVRNELGIPISMCLLGKSNWTSISHKAEVEVGAQSEALVSSADQKSSSRDRALRCSILIPLFAPQELSASEAGKHTVLFYAPSSSTSSYQSSSSSDADLSPLEIVWDVELRNGVPLCTVRSPFQLMNNTKTSLDVFILPIGEEIPQEPLGCFEDMVSLKPGEHFSVPVHDLDKAVHLRPVISSKIHLASESSQSLRPFQWSSALPRVEQLLAFAHERLTLDRELSSSSSRKTQRSLPLLSCKPHQDDGQGYFFELLPMASKSQDNAMGAAWLDVSIRAPLALTNKLPGQLSYRIYQSEEALSSSSLVSTQSDRTIVATGVINALDTIYLHFSDERLGSMFLSTAFENGGTSSQVHVSQHSTQMPIDFGPGVCLGDIVSGKIKAIYPSPVQSEDLKGQARKHFRANILNNGDGIRNIIIHAGFWVRNRSDTPIEICSRQSFYGTGSISFYLRARPPNVQPDNYVCSEGPFLSVRLPKRRENGVEIDQSNWWTSSSTLDDIDKPLSISIAGRSFELDIRPSVGLGCGTYIVTIRNSSWIVNSTPSSLQWCEQSSLDAHGNCPTRLLKSLKAGEAQGLHWNSKTSIRSIHLRLADENGQSEWIWSPAIPLDLGHSRELPAKMYRPRTHDQYIARVASKEVAGNSRALVVYEEDRQNPPYRIINVCKERAIAFSQNGSQERPWLVRAGKNTRYSWDDPLAPPKDRELSIRIIEKEDLMGNPSTSIESGQRSRTWRAPPSVLNIDKVGDRVKVLGDPFDPPVIFNVSVDGATKVITLFDEGTDVGIPSSNRARNEPTASRDNEEVSFSSEDGGRVPIVGWDDISVESKSSSKQIQVDYPKKTENNDKNQFRSTNSFSGTDAAIFLNSVGISVIDGEPEELLYLSSTGILVNYEASNEEQNVLLTVERLQVDNQTAKTPFPVLLWMKSPDVKENDSGEGSATSRNALVIELHRDLTMDDILMVKSFQAQVCPFNLSFEEGLVSKLLRFIDVSTIGGKTKYSESLDGTDDEGMAFTELMPGISHASTREKGSNSTSLRIYLHHFKISSSSIRLTSTGSGSTIAKAAGLNASARAIVGLLLNVENCSFEFPALIVNNAFDSLHHFGVLIRTYYIQQLDNQRIKLLTSNSLVGNPAALFDAVGTGARDFLSEPGRAKGSVDFFAGAVRGSKSLLTHTVGGFVESVSSIPRAVSTGLERAVGDNDYLAERERIRGSALTSGQRGTTRNTAQGFATGAISLAHGISSGMTGFIREPVQGAKQGGAGGLLKGIGKAFIGGVAKPVAGAMDFVAEPAAGLSRQIADVEGSEGVTVAIPDRPPRAFRGNSQRIERFDRWYSTGVWLLKAVCMSSRVSVQARLVDWVELSDRAERKRTDADLWVWYIVQRFSRCMPGTKKQIRSEIRQRFRGKSSVEPLDLRPEKTRAALLTDEAIIIATLDCKLVSMIPIWEDADYEIITDGKELIVRATIVQDDKIATVAMQSGTSTLFQGAQLLIHAPWDVSNFGKRRKPAVGQTMVERIVCGSVDARDDLRHSLGKIVKQKKELRGRHSRRDWASNDPMARGQEMAVPSQWHGEGGEEPKTPQGEKDMKMGGFGAQSGMKMGSEQSIVRNAARLQRTVEQLLTDASGNQRRQNSGPNVTVRIIVANEIGSREVELRMKEGSIEHGQWLVDAPLVIKEFDAQVMEVGEADECDENHTITGNVLYGVFEGGEVGRNREIGQVEINFFNELGAAASFATKASKGFSVKYGTSPSSSLSDSSVFRVSRATGEGNAKNDNASNASVASASDANISGDDSNASNDEKLLQQLMDIGFKLEDAVVALADAGGNIVKAVDLLMS